MQIKCRLLPDVPAQKDAFGSHEKVAKALFGIISGAESGKAVALIGGWGSGKSTVINILTGLLRDNQGHSQDVGLFVFDAWAHEGDPLRRSFLERLVVFLSNWLDETRESWNDVLNELQRRRKVEEIISTPYLTNWGSAVVFSLVLIPLGLLLFENAVVQSSIYKLIAAVMLTTAPLLLGIAAALFGKGSSGEGNLRVLAGLLLNKSVESTRTTSVHTPEPTSVEFEKYFVKVISEAIGEKKDRKLCIVIDNLDRLSHVDAAKLLATLKPFLQSNETIGSIWKRVTFVIPFDESGLVRLWDQGGSLDETLSGEQKVGKSFLEKIFQIKIFVPRQLVSDWQKYMKESLKTAFPGIKEQDVYRVVRIFDVAVANAKKVTPTPRQVISFVNHIVGIYLQWDDGLPIVHQAVFVVLRTYWDCHDLEVLRKKLPELAVLKDYCEADRLEDDIAALYFNVEPETARVLWIEPEVEQALKTANVKYFLENKEKKGLAELIDSVLEKRIADWKDKEPRFLVDSAAAIRETSFQQASGRLKKKIQEIEKWSFLDKTGASRLLEIFRGEREILLGILNSVGRMEKPKEGIAPTAVIQALLTLIDGYKKQFERLGPDEFLMDIDENQYVQALSIASRMNFVEATVKCLRVKDSLQDRIVQVFGKLISEGKLDESISPALRLYTTIVEPVEKVEPLVQPLFARINSGGQLALSEIFGLSLVLLSFRKSFSDPASSFRKSLKECMETGWLFHNLHLVSASNGKAKRTQSNLILLMCLEPVQNWRRQAPYGQNGYNLFTATLPNTLQTDSELARTIAEIAIEFGYVRELINIVKIGSTASAVASRPIMKSIIQMDQAYQLIGDADIIGNFSLFREISSEATNRMILEGSESTLVATLEANSFGVDHIPIIILLFERPGIQERASFLSWVINGIKSIDKNIWARELIEENSALFTLARTLDGKINEQLGQPHFQAVDELIHKVKDGAVNSAQVKVERLQACSRWLEARYADTLKRNCRDILLRQTDDDKVESFLATFLPFLTDEEIMGEEADDFVRLMFPKVIAKQIPVTSIEMLVQNCPSVWEKARTASREVFLSQLTSKLEDSEEVMKNDLARLKSILAGV